MIVVFFCFVLKYYIACDSIFIKPKLDISANVWMCSQLLAKHGIGGKSSHHYITRSYKLILPSLFFLGLKRKLEKLQTITLIWTKCAADIIPQPKQTCTREWYEPKKGGLIPFIKSHKRKLIPSSSLCVLISYIIVSNWLMVGLSSETSFSGTLASNLSLLSDEVVAYDPRACQIIKFQVVSLPQL